MIYIYFSVVDWEILQDLEQTTQLNRFENFRKLFPKETTGDGNCLLHAAMFITSGKDDLALEARKNLNKVLADQKLELTLQMKKIWKSQEMSKDDVYGYSTFSEEDWEREWDLLVKLSSPDPKHKDNYTMLEEFHVFALANMIKRPIIIVAAKFIYSLDGDEFSPNNIGGVYLPLIHPPTECCKSPIVLAYSNSHFCPLIPAAGNEETKIVLTDLNNQLFTLHYAVDASPAPILLQDYLDISFENHDNHIHTVARIDASESLMTLGASAHNSDSRTNSESVGFDGFDRFDDEYHDHGNHHGKDDHE